MIIVIAIIIITISIIIVATIIIVVFVRSPSLPFFDFVCHPIMRSVSFKFYPIMSITM